MTQGTYARPYVNQYPTLLTYQDLIDRLLSFSNAGTQASQAIDYRIAIEESYREVINRHQWKYFNTQYVVYTQPEYTTGSIAYSQSTRTVTLTGGTFPSWANLARIRIGTAAYEIIANPSGTTLTLSVANNPGGDIASGTGFVLYQSVFRLPADYRGNFRWNVPTLLWSNSFIQLDEWFSLERRCAAGGNPRNWALAADPQLQGTYSIFVWPHPVTNTTYGGIYQRRPRDLSVSGYDVADADFSSTATIANTGAAVTGTNTLFSARHIGCALRFGTATKNPNGSSGLYPYQEQRIITAVADTTHCTLDSAPVGTYAGVKYTISDPLDLSPGMLNAVLACIKLQYALNKPLEDRPLSSLRESYRQAYVTAQESDALVLSGRGGGATFDRMHDQTYTTFP